MKKHFGTDGIRGIAFEKLNSQLAFKLGQALAKSYKFEELVIGQDTRLSSNMLAYGVAYGAALAGVNVKIAEVVSTPMVAYYSKVNNIFGVMITASHNPYTDNGIKVIKSGYKLLDEEDLELEKYIDEDDILVSPKFGSITVTREVEELYLSVYSNLNLPKTSMKVTDPNNIFNIDHDGVLISSYLHQNTIENNLDKLKYDKKKIIRLFKD